MYPWLYWAPQIHFPWSGNVMQDISPTIDWFFGSIPSKAGVGEIEKEVFRTASYGRQLGLLAEIVLSLAKSPQVSEAKAKESLAEFEKLHAEIEAVKRQTRSQTADRLAGELGKLRDSDPAAFEAVMRKVAAP